MNEIENELIAFIMENPFSSRDDIFNDFSKERKGQGKIPVNPKLYSQTINRLLKSNRIEEVSEGYGEFVSYKTAFNTNSINHFIKKYDPTAEEILNKNISNLNRIVNFIIINEGSSSEELTEKFVYGPGFFGFDLSEEELWHYLSFLKRNNCVREERIDNMSFKYLPLEFSVGIFKSIEDHKVLKEREKIKEDQRLKSIPWYKTYGSIFLIFSSFLIAILIYGYIQTYLPFVFPLLVFLIIIFKKSKRIGY